MDQQVSTTKQFMVVREGRPVGPLKAAELQAQAREGAISPLDLVCAVGSDKWVLGYQVKGLFPAWLAAEIRERLAKGEGVDDLLQASPSSRQESIKDERVVILVVDGDRSSTSRRFIGGIGSADSVEVVIVQDADSARHKAQSGQGHALLIVGEGFEEGFRGGGSIPIAVEEYVPDLLKKRGISMQSLINEAAQGIQSVKTTVSSGDEAETSRALKNRKAARNDAQQRMKLEWSLAGLFGLIGVGLLVNWISGLESRASGESLFDAGLIFAVLIILGAVCFLIDINRGFRTRCERCGLHWGYAIVDRIITGYSHGVRHTRQGDYVHIQNSHTGSFRQYWIDRPVTVQTETEHSQVFEQCRSCSHQRVRNESQRYDL